MKLGIAAALCVSLLLGTSMNAAPPARPGLYDDSNFFPVAVWLQSPGNAKRYKAAGINLYVGLWQGPTEAQLAELKAADMRVICDQNEVGLKHIDNPLIVAWMHGDEPDNAQAVVKDGKQAWGPPIPPAKIIADYHEVKKRDPSRPVFLNLGMGVAWDGWYGRGERTNKPEDYPQYVKGGDIISFDIYPVADKHKDVRNNLWLVARGVERLVEWTGGKKPVWSCIECTQINADQKATPYQVKAEVWMALIHGARGLIYFVHEWQPKFNEHALLDDLEMLSGVTAINKQIHALAQVLNSPTLPTVKTESSNKAVPVATMLKRHDGATYLFAVAMRDGATDATFTLPGVPRDAEVEVIGEERTLRLRDGRLTDAFKGYEVHLYRIAARR